MSDLRPAYFVVRRRYGREVPEIYWDELPREPLRGLVYVVRLDQLPGAASLTGQPTTWLYRLFCQLRRQGKLPPRWVPPPPKQAGKAVIKFGHRESPRDVVQRSRQVYPDV